MDLYHHASLGKEAIMQELSVVSDIKFANPIARRIGAIGSSDLSDTQ
jgi:hypothetical protein